jgi:hypothetical protein
MNEEIDDLIEEILTIQEVNPEIFTKKEDESRGRKQKKGTKSIEREEN